ncbi:MAG: gamma-glutamyltransferase family protein [Fidelibacterota bacterium]
MTVNFKKIEDNFQVDSNGKSTVSQDGMVATQSSHATEIGKRMLEQKGNAVDAAVAAALALGVCEPQASGLGGQTMLLIGNEDQIIAIDGSSRAPSLAHASSIYKDDRSLGYRATTVPSTPATLWYTHNNYGRLKWEAILEPVIELAENGFPTTALQSRLQNRELKKFLRVPSQSGLRYFLKDGKPYNNGEIFKQPELAQLLRRLSEKGIYEFYRGKVAKQIDADMRENGGILRYDDLALIPFPIEREPISTNFRDLEVYTMPPPGAGMTLIYALNMLQFIGKEYRFDNESHFYHILIKIIREAFLERSDRPYDANFFQQISDSTTMLDLNFAYESIKKIVKDVDKQLLPIIPSEDEMAGETTHLSVIDKDGFAVSLTQSIERVYGSKAVADGLGFLYNNYLFDFDYNKPEHPYYIRPNSNPWATVAPSLIYNDKTIWMSLGSPGSERIVSTLLLFLLRITDHNYSIDKAMKAPRLHCSLGGKVSLEAGRFSRDVISYLRKQEYRIEEKEDFAFYLGCIQAVLKRQSGEGFQGIADVRRDGTAQ